MSVAQTGKCGTAFTQRRTGHMADPTPTGVSAPDICGSEGRAVASAAGPGDSESIGGSKSRRRSRGNVDATSVRSVCPLRGLLQNDQLSGIDHQCIGGRAVCQGGSVDELESAAALVRHRVEGYRAVAPQGEGLLALASVTRGPETRLTH